MIVFIVIVPSFKMQDTRKSRISHGPGNREEIVGIVVWAAKGFP